MENATHVRIIGIRSLNLNIAERDRIKADLVHSLVGSQSLWITDSCLGSTQPDRVDTASRGCSIVLRGFVDLLADDFNSIGVVVSILGIRGRL